MTKTGRFFFPIFLTSIILLTALTTFLLLPCKKINASNSEVYFTVLHTNDEHSALIPHPLETQDRGGFARLAGLIKQIKESKMAANEEVILLSAADFISEFIFCWLILDGQTPEISLMTEIGYDAVTLGNHEFDYGVDVLTSYLSAAQADTTKTPPLIISSNVVAPPNHPLAEIIKKTSLIKLDNGLTIGMLGLLGEDASRLSILTEPLELLDPFAAAADAVDELKKQGADVIICLSHAGVDEDIALASKTKGIDLVVGGHTHTPLHEPIIQGNTIIVQAGYALDYLGFLEFAYDPQSKALRLRNAESNQPFLMPIDQSVAMDPGIARKVEAYTDDLNRLVTDLTNGRVRDIEEVLALAPYPLYNIPPGEHRWQNEETPLGNFVTDAIHLAVEEAVGDKVHFTGIVNGHIRENIDPGFIKFYDLARMSSLGFGPDNKPGLPLITYFLTGQELWTTLERQIFLSDALCSIYYMQLSGGRLRYDPERAVLMRVPLIDLPLPTFHAIASLEYYDSETNQYIAIPRNDQTLYRVASDYYMGLYLAILNDHFLRYQVFPKDENGNPAAIDDCIIYVDGQEYKAWQALMNYALDQPLNQEGVPQIVEDYRVTGERIEQVKLTPLWIWLVVLIILMIMITALIYFILKSYLRKKALR